MRTNIVPTDSIHTRKDSIIKIFQERIEHTRATRLTHHLGISFWVPNHIQAQRKIPAVKLSHHLRMTHHHICSFFVKILTITKTQNIIQLTRFFVKLKINRLINLFKHLFIHRRFNRTCDRLDLSPNSHLLGQHTSRAHIPSKSLFHQPPSFHPVGGSNYIQHKSILNGLWSPHNSTR